MRKWIWKNKYFLVFIIIFLFTFENNYITNNYLTNQYNTDNSIENYSLINCDKNNLWFSIGKVSFDSSEYNINHYNKINVDISYIKKMNGNPIFELDYKLNNTNQNSIYSNNNDNFKNSSFIINANCDNKNNILECYFNMSITNYDPVAKKKTNWYNVILSFSINMQALINVNNSINIDNEDYILNIPDQFYILNKNLYIIDSTKFNIHKNEVVNNYLINNIFTISSGDMNKYDIHVNSTYTSDDSNYSDSVNINYKSNSENEYDFYVDSFSYFDDISQSTYFSDTIKSNNYEKGISINYYKNVNSIINNSLSFYNGLTTVNINIIETTKTKSIFYSIFNINKYEYNGDSKNNNYIYSSSEAFNKYDISKYVNDGKWK